MIWSSPSKKSLGGEILYRSPDAPKKRHQNKNYVFRRSRYMYVRGINRATIILINSKKQCVGIISVRNLFLVLSEKLLLKTLYIFVTMLNQKLNIISSRTPIFLIVKKFKILTLWLIWFILYDVFLIFD